jgi:hypothetical protein
MICDFLEIFLKKFFWGVLHQAVRAVSKNRPKYPMLDIPFVVITRQCIAAIYCIKCHLFVARIVENLIESYKYQSKK